MQTLYDNEHVDRKPKDLSEEVYMVNVSHFDMMAHNHNKMQRQKEMKWPPLDLGMGHSGLLE